MDQAELASITSRTPVPRPRQRSDVERHHWRLIVALTQHKPHVIRYNADRFDIIERADHIRDVLQEVNDYVKAIIADTRYQAAISIEVPFGALDDAPGEISGALRNASDRLIQEDA